MPPFYAEVKQTYDVYPKRRHNFPFRAHPGHRMDSPPVWTGVISALPFTTDDLVCLGHETSSHRGEHSQKALRLHNEL